VLLAVQPGLGSARVSGRLFVPASQLVVPRRLAQHDPQQQQRQHNRRVELDWERAPGCWTLACALAWRTCCPPSTPRWWLLTPLRPPACPPRHAAATTPATMTRRSSAPLLMSRCPVTTLKRRPPRQHARLTDSHRPKRQGARACIDPHVGRSSVRPPLPRLAPPAARFHDQANARHQWLASRPPCVDRQCRPRSRRRTRVRGQAWRP